MQDFMREQVNNAKSYNMITLITTYASEFKNHLHYPVAFDTFQTTLDAILEFVQGPNRTNQEIVIQYNFVDLANDILTLEYNEEALQTGEKFNPSKMLSKKLSYLSQMPSMKPSSIKESATHKYDMRGSDITAPSSNFMTSLIKYKCLSVLLQLLVGRKHPSYIFYLYRRVLEPDTFRLNFAYQSYFMEKFHKNEYTLDLFFRYDQHIDQNIESPLIIEIGFLLYFLLMSMQENLHKDMDEKYFKRIIVLLSQKSEASSAVSKSVVTRFFYFCSDFYKLTTR